MLDRDGFSTRGIGELKLILSGTSEEGVMLMSQTEWECDLTDAEMNQRYFDEVTRTYQAVLELDAQTDVPWEPTLRAILLLPNGDALTDSSRIRFAKRVEPAPDEKTDPDQDASETTSTTEY